MSSCGPRIVATFSAQSQVGAIASTTLYTPSADGNYRLSTYWNMASNTFHGDSSLAISWTDDHASPTPPILVVDNGVAINYSGSGTPTGYYQQTTHFFRAKSSNAITVAASSTFNNNTDAYNFYVVLEEL